MDELTFANLLAEAPTSAALMLGWWMFAGRQAWARLVESVRLTSEGLRELADEVHAERVERARADARTHRRLRRLELAAGIDADDASEDFGAGGTRG